MKMSWFVIQDRIENMVEVGGFVGRSGVRCDDLMDAIIDPGNLIDLTLGLWVVGIGANENVVIVIVNGLAGVGESLGDHVRFVPGSNKIAIRCCSRPSAVHR